MILKNKLAVSFLAMALLFVSSCSVKFSFTGADLSHGEKTFSVQAFQNRAKNVNPSLTQKFEESLKDKFISQTSLILTNDYGDLNFEGEITEYSIRPTAITGDETAAMNQFKITIKVKFVNEKDPEKNYESSFSKYREYSSERSFEEVEEGLVEEILDDIIEAIFNRSVVNW